MWDKKVTPRSAGVDGHSPLPVVLAVGLVAAVVVITRAVWRDRAAGPRLRIRSRGQDGTPTGRGVQISAQVLPQDTDTDLIPAVPPAEHAAEHIATHPQRLSGQVAVKPTVDDDGT